MEVKWAWALTTDTALSQSSIGAQYPKQNMIEIRVFKVALLNGQKIQISLQLPDRDFTWRVPSTAHWTLQESNLIFSFVKLLIRP